MCFNINAVVKKSCIFYTNFSTLTAVYTYMGVHNNGILFHFSVNMCPLLLLSYELTVSTVVVCLANQLAQQVYIP